MGNIHSNRVETVRREQNISIDLVGGVNPYGNSNPIQADIFPEEYMS